MIQAVASSHFPYLPVHVQIGTPQVTAFEFDVEPLVDTGFDGGLAVPKDLIPTSVTPIGQSVWNLADGTQIAAFAYFAQVTIGQLPPVPTMVIGLGDEPLLGRNVTNHFKLTFDHGTQVVIEP